MTHHNGDHPHVEVPQLIPEITVDPGHIPHTNQVKISPLNPHRVLTGQQ